MNYDLMMDTGVVFTIGTQSTMKPLCGKSGRKPSRFISTLSIIIIQVLNCFLYGLLCCAQGGFFYHQAFCPALYLDIV